MVISKKDGELSYLDIGDSQLSPVLNTMTTPRGRQYSLVLADGSKVWLNAETSITYPTVFTGSERKVIINGEAYFEIAHNADMPFIVEKGNIKVEVLGTHFNVNAYDDEIMIRTTLLEGSVRIYGTANQTSAKILKPGQQALINSGKDINVVNADLDEVMAWKNGYFHFSKSSIESIMRQVSRWYDVDIDYEGKTTQLFKGEVPRSVNVSTLLKILESTGWVHFRIDGKKITVMQ